MRTLNLLTLFVLMMGLVGCSALEHLDRTPAAKRAHKNFMQKKETNNFYWKWDRADGSDNI